MSVSRYSEMLLLAKGFTRVTHRLVLQNGFDNK